MSTRNKTGKSPPISQFFYVDDLKLDYILNSLPIAQKNCIDIRWYGGIIVLFKCFLHSLKFTSI